jgi:peptidoglycan/LPS O-acetylase OafA/YrhL
MPVSATAAFVVLRRWQVWSPAAALGGLLYGFSPYMVGQSRDHIELIFVPLPPFIALTVVSILQRRGSPLRLGIQLGLLVTAQYLISPEITAIVGVLTVAAVVFTATSGTPVLDRANESGPFAIVPSMAGAGDGRTLSLVDTGASRTYRPDVEGLRAVAVLQVLFFHFNVEGFKAGFVGVDVFFVISGFVITAMLIRSSADRRISLADFFARRARRILPVAVTVLVLTVALTRLMFGHSGAHYTVWPAQLILLFVFNLDTQAVARMANLGDPLSNYWTLGVEEQFYVIFPVLLAAAWTFGRRWNWRAKAEVIVAALTLASFAWSLHAPSFFTLSAYYGTFTRGWQIGLGCLLAFSMERFAALPAALGAVLAWAGLALVFYAGATVTASSGYPKWSGLLPTGGAALVIVGGTATTRVGSRDPAPDVARSHDRPLVLWDIPLADPGASRHSPLLGCRRAAPVRRPCPWHSRVHWSRCSVLRGARVPDPQMARPRTKSTPHPDAGGGDHPRGPCRRHSDRHLRRQEPLAARR